MRVLMVCLGNICRSPLAEGILRHLADAEGLDWHVDSAGTGSWHIGEPPDPRSVAVAARNGLDISAQRARKFNYGDFSDFDLIFAMDRSNYRDIIAQSDGQEESDKVQLILKETAVARMEDVPDPYWDDHGFDKVFNMLFEACTVIVDKYR